MPTESYSNLYFEVLHMRTRRRDHIPRGKQRDYQGLAAVLSARISGSKPIQLGLRVWADDLHNFNRSGSHSQMWGIVGSCAVPANIRADENRFRKANTTQKTHKKPSARASLEKARLLTGTAPGRCPRFNPGWPAPC